MSIKKLLFETAIAIILITCLVIVVSSFQIRYNAYKHFVKLQEQYFNATYDIYKDEIAGDLLINNQQIILALLQEIADRRGVGLSLIYNSIKLQAGKFFPHSFSKSYQINLGNKNKAIFIIYPTNELKVPWLFNELGVPLLLEILVLGLGFIYLLWRFRKRLLIPLADLVIHLKNNQLDSYTPATTAVLEVKELSQTLHQMQDEIQKKALFEAEAKAAKQVGHDIRSPLACLTLLLSQAEQLPEEQRTLMRTSIQRITDIANSLYNRCQKKCEDTLRTKRIESFMISSLVDELISEKRMQLREKENICIDLDLEKSYGLFAEVDPVEFKRVLSNLSDNCVEAFDQKPHRIHVIVEQQKTFVQITIQDDGKGIPPGLLKKIGEYGFSYGKERNANAGSGLGLYHAINTVQSLGGSLTVRSKEYDGTTVVIQLPQGEVPSWFIRELKLEKIHMVIILDDDQSIHNLWRDKFGRLKTKNIPLLCFSCGTQFSKYLSELGNKKEGILFLMDYELLHQNRTGLDLIEQFHLEKQALLVTSYYEDSKIRERAEKMGVQMIPKGMAAFVPIMG